MSAARIERVVGRPVPIRGDDIDTDRIIPARFMTAVTFDGLGEKAFFDARFDAAGKPLPHPLNDARYRSKGPQVAVVNANFGCGSSREHAPQALKRWGFAALVGESFADIFFGNCVALGMPCVTAGRTDVERLQRAVEEDPAHDLTVDLVERTVAFRDLRVAVSIPEGAREQLLSGRWDATASLLEAGDRIRETAARLPYLRGFAA